jgi:hypothetical protein
MCNATRGRKDDERKSSADTAEERASAPLLLDATEVDPMIQTTIVGS